MLCDECNKNLATVHLTKVVNGVMMKTHLCEECAQDASGDIPQLFGFSDLIASIPQIIATLFDTAPPPDTTLGEQALRCSNCDSSFDDLRETGRVGCAACYDSFSERMEPLLRRMHGNPEHKGKIPARAGKHLVVARHMKNLRVQLEECIGNEDFEQAASLRDQIRALEVHSGQMTLKDQPVVDG